LLTEGERGEESAGGLLGAATPLLTNTTGRKEVSFILYLIEECTVMVEEE
jgi:hypothetical protein